MFKLVLRIVSSKRISCQVVFGDVLVQVQQNTQTCLCDEGMNGCHRNVVTVRNNAILFGKAERVRKFDDLGVFDIDPIAKWSM